MLPLAANATARSSGYAGLERLTRGSQRARRHPDWSRCLISENAEVSQTVTDVELVDRYVTHQDEAAFHDLVVRHRTRILNRCRQILPNGHDAEDALQGTLLVFLQKIASIQQPELLGAWLNGVACRVAIRIRRRNFCRRRRETSFVDAQPEQLPSVWSDHEIRLTLAEELRRLPNKYRLPIVLCYWEGQTHEQAADRLAWPVGTVKIRLVRGRKMLRSRLDRSGLSL
jgi:RNA polymerase sigma factor (sigma-70 family)